MEIGVLNARRGKVEVGPLQSVKHGVYVRDSENLRCCCRLKELVGSVCGNLGIILR